MSQQRPSRMARNNLTETANGNTLVVANRETVTGRPTRTRRINQEAVSVDIQGYAVIGDTEEALAYSFRLLKNGTTVPIKVISQGSDYMQKDDVDCAAYPICNQLQSLTHLNAETVKYCAPGESQNDSDTTLQDDTVAVDQVVNYQTPDGVNGDVLGSYLVLRAGPWFDSDNDSKVQSFIKEHTETFPLTLAEGVVADRLAAAYSIPIRKDAIRTKDPCILGATYVFATEEGETVDRELFRHYYDTVNDTNTTDLVSEVDRLTIANGTITGLNNVTVSFNDETQTYVNYKVVWMTNPYSYLRLASEAGLHPDPINIPTVYRSVINIPKNNSSTGGVDLTNETDLGDLVTSSISWSLYDNESPKHSSISWAIFTYTAVEDLADTNRGGKFATTGNTLLITEAISFGNRRSMTYDLGQNMQIVNFNSRLKEANYMERFREISRVVYTAYTGTVAPAFSNFSITGTGVATEHCQVSNVPLRESSISTVMELINHLYPGKLYPIAGKTCRCN